MENIAVKLSLDNFGIGRQSVGTIIRSMEEVGLVYKSWKVVTLVYFLSRFQSSRTKFVVYGLLNAGSKG